MHKRQLPDFYPPKLNPVLVQLGQQVVSLVAHWYYRFDLVVSQADLDCLRSLQHQRLLLLPNHPTFDDPIVIFNLSARLGIPFYYLSAREAFRQSGKIAVWLAFLERFGGGVATPQTFRSRNIFQDRGYWLQRLGVYSIRRGMVDRASVAQTLQILTQPDCKLVIFAEGGCSFQNDTVMPFRAGAIQMAFQAMNKVLKLEKSLPDLYAVPISLKYCYTQDMTNAIAHSLNQLEKALQIDPEGDFYQRLRVVAVRFLLKCEQEYGLIEPGSDLNQRVTDLKQHVLQHCEQRLGLSSAPGEPERERTYRIQQALEQENNYNTSEQIWTRQVMAKAAWRVLNFDAIYDGYVAATLTQERFLDTLIRLERDVFNIDKPRPKGDRQALLHVGQPINLKDWFTEYQQNRAGTVNTVVQTIHRQVQQNLDSLACSLPAMPT